MRDFKIVLLLSAAICCAGCLHAGPVVLFSDFGAGMSFGNSNITIGGGGPGSQVIADQFVPSITAIYTSVEVAVGAFNNAPVSVFLESDSGGSPGSVLEEIELPGLALAGRRRDRDFVYSSATHGGHSLLARLDRTDCRCNGVLAHQFGRRSHHCNERGR